MDIAKQTKTRVMIVGARGYSGLELARLCLKHPAIELKSCVATGPFRLADHISGELARQIPPSNPEDLFHHIQAGEVDLVFLATPAEASMDLAPKILEFGVRVIDLSGAFRLEEADYPSWYRQTHTSAALLDEAHYGLVPFAKPSLGTRLISNPGCYATAVLMGLLPLLQENVIDLESIVIDAKSGTTGAGKKAEERLLHSEVDESCLPYRIGDHQHHPEIERYLEKWGGRKIDFHFTPHLLPVRRGILAGIYARSSGGDLAAKTKAAFQKVYGEYEGVEVAETSEQPSLLHLRRVVGTGKTQIVWRAHQDKLYLFSLIDNLMKGAASQAIENFNLASELPVFTGLSHLEGVL